MRSSCQHQTEDFKDRTVFFLNNSSDHSWRHFALENNPINQYPLLHNPTQHGGVFSYNRPSFADHLISGTRPSPRALVGLNESRCTCMCFGVSKPGDIDCIFFLFSFFFFFELLFLCVRAHDGIWYSTDLGVRRHRVQRSRGTRERLCWWLGWWWRGENRKPLIEGNVACWDTCSLS